MGAAGAFDKLVRRRADRDAASLKRRVVCALCNLAVKASAARVLAPALALAPATGHYAKRNLMAVNGPFQGLCRGAHASKSQLYFVDATGWPTTYPLSMFKKLDVVEVSARLGASHKETFGVCYVRRALRSPRVCALGCVVWRVLAPRASKLAGVCWRLSSTRIVYVASDSRPRTERVLVAASALASVWRARARVTAGCSVDFSFSSSLNSKLEHRRLAVATSFFSPSKLLACGC